MNAARLVGLGRPLALPLLGTIVGLGVAGLIWIHHHSDAVATAYHGRYVPLDGITTSNAYSSTLTLTLTNHGHHTGPSALLIGAAIGLFAGVAVAVVLNQLSGSWPSGSARR